MSWAEVKKINSDLNTPLDELIKTGVNSDTSVPLDKYLNQQVIAKKWEYSIGSTSNRTVIDLHGKYIINALHIACDSYRDSSQSTRYYQSQFIIYRDSTSDAYANVTFEPPASSGFGYMYFDIVDPSMLVTTTNPASRNTFYGLPYTDGNATHSSAGVWNLASNSGREYTINGTAQTVTPQQNGQYYCTSFLKNGFYVNERFILQFNTINQNLSTSSKATIYIEYIPLD